MSSWIKLLFQQESRPGHLLVTRKNAVLIHYCFGFIFHTQKSHSSFIYRPVPMPTTSHSLKSSTLCEIMLPLLKGLLLKWYCRNTPASFGTLLPFSPETRTSNQHLLWFILLSNGCIKIIHHLLKKNVSILFQMHSGICNGDNKPFPKMLHLKSASLFSFSVCYYTILQQRKMKNNPSKKTLQTWTQSIYRILSSIFLNAYPVQIGEEIGPCTSLNGAESGVQVDQVGILSHLHLII